MVAFKIYATIETVFCFNWLPWTSTASSHWEKFLEINLNQDIEHIDSWLQWKKQHRSAIRNHALLCMNKDEYLHCWHICWKILTQIHQKTGCFLMFPRGTKRGQCHEMSWESFNFYLFFWLYKWLKTIYTMVNLSHVDKIVIFPNTWLFVPVQSMHNLLPSYIIYSWLCFVFIDCSLHTKWVRENVLLNMAQSWPWGSQIAGKKGHHFTDISVPK